MTRIRLLVSYDGTDFCGWQKQKHGKVKSVGHVLEEAISKIFSQKIHLFASGRTDAGVHALNQVCHFDVDRPESFFTGKDVAWSLNSQLPPTIRVKRVWIAPPKFHATLSATHKTYRYYILNQNRNSPFWGRYSQWIRPQIPLEHLQESSKYLLGHHDFKSFQSVGTEVLTTDRTIYRADWIWKRPNLAQFTITGSGFLKQMVRNIVGTQLLLQKKGEDPSKMAQIIAARDRQIAGPPAEAQGLFLMKVYYPQDLDIQCREL